MDIEKILEYQAEDLVIYKADREYVNSAENRKYVDLRNKINATSEQLVRLDKEAGAIYKEVERLETALNAYVEKSKTTPISGAKTLEQSDKLDENINRLQDELNAIEKEIKKYFQRLTDISKEAKVLHGKYVKLLNEAKIAMDARNAKREEILKTIAPNGAKIQELKKKLDPKDYEIYMRVRQAKIKLPIVVEFNNGHCAGCGMEIDTEVGAKLQNSGDIAECPHCRRIVYRK